MNLLDFDMGSGPTTTTTVATIDSSAPANSGNLLDDMFSGPSTANAPQQSNDLLSGQFDSMLGGFGGSSPAQAPVPKQLKYQGVPGFTTASFGQTWMGMTTPGSELKFTLPTPQSIGGVMGGNLPELYSQKLGSCVGIQKVEVINNEVIAAGQPINNIQQVALIHCRVSQQSLDFTVRSVDATLTQQLVQEVSFEF